MIERYGWDALPDAVQDAVRAHLGDVTVVRDVAQGQNCNVAIVIQGDAGTVFLKGVEGVSLRMRWLRNEADAGTLAPGIAPSTHFIEDIEPDWLMVGSEYVAGRPADLTPGSEDLAAVAETVTRISGLPGATAPPLSERWAVSDWWTKLADAEPEQVDGWNVGEMTGWCALTAELVDGSALLHTDLHEHQFVISDGEPVRVIDWGRPASGAAWVDVAFLVIRLIAAGHEPHEAEQWAATVPSWSTAADKALTAFACYVAGLWSFRGATAPFAGSVGLSAAAKCYALYRLTK